MTRGQLPKAYLRIDPNVDQTHPDGLDGFIRLLCAANRQRPRGRFRSRATLDALFGKRAVDRLYARGDVASLPDGSVDVPGWTDWQEGDLTVGDRMRRLRASPVRNTDVTEPSPNRNPPSEASRRLGVKASTDVESDGARDPEPEFPVLQWLNAHGCYVRPGNGYHQRLVHAVERHDPAAMVAMLDRLHAAGVHDGDVKGLLFGAIDALDAASRPKLDNGAAERAVRSKRIDEAMWKRRVEQYRFAGTWDESWGAPPEANA